jgi:hypothetical protein
MGGWTKEVFNNNILPLTHDQEVLRTDVQAWMAELYRMGAIEINFVMVGDRFPSADYTDLMKVYDDFHRAGFVEEIHARR